MESMVDSVQKFLVPFVITLTCVVHVVFAFVLWDDANTVRREGGRTFGPPYVWALAALVGSIWSLAIYWVIHHSTLRLAARPPA